MFYRTDAAGVVVYCNSAVTRVFGYPRDEIVGYPLSKIYVNPAERERVLQTILDAKGEYVHVEAWVKRRDGAQRWASTHARALFDACGKFAGVEGSGRDATANIAMLTAIQRSERLLRQSEALAKTGAWEYDVAGAKMTWSQGTYEIFEVDRDYDPSRMVPNAALYADSHRDRIRSSFQLALDTGAPYDLEFQIRSAKGNPKWVRVVSNAEMAAGKVVRVYGNILDVTARVDGERMLRLEHAVTKCIAQAGSTTAALKDVMRYLCETENWTLGSFWRVDPKAGVLRFEEYWNIPGFDDSLYPQACRELQFAPGHGIVGCAWASGEAIWSEDASNDGRVVQKELLRGQLGSIFAFPIFAAERTVGVFSFLSSTMRRPEARLLAATRVIGDQMGQFLERKHTEQALQASQDQFRKLVESSPLAIALVNADGVIEYINHKAVAMFGYAPEDIPVMDRWWAQAYPDAAYRAEVIALWTRLAAEARAADREIESGEYRVTCKDGSVKITAIFGAWIDDKVLVLFEDVTERRRAEREIAQALDRFRFLAESARVYAWSRDIDTGTLTYLTPYEPLLGPLPDGGRNSPFRGLVHPQDLEKYETATAHAIATFSEYELEVRIRRTDGEPRWVLIRGKGYRDPSGGSTTLAGVTIDITERKRVEEQIRNLNQDLERRVRERTAELTLANELLNSEIGVRRAAEASAQNLAARVKNLTRRLWDAQEAERRWLATELHDGVCGNLVGLGLNIAVADKQLAAGDLSGVKARLEDIASQTEEIQLSARNLAQVDLRPLLEEGKDLVPTLRYFAESFADRFGMAVDFDVDGPFSEERLTAAAKIALYRIAQEALTNCAKHAKPNRVMIEICADEDGIEMTISDDGAGFEPNAASGATRGLGLLSMQERAEAIGGVWSLESAPGSGTRIAVTLGATSLA